MFYQLKDDILYLHVRLTPKAAQDAVKGVDRTADGHDYLAVRVRAMPEGGKANKALIKFLAKKLHVPASSITLKSGATSRIKYLCFAHDTDRLMHQFEVLQNKK